MPGLGKILKKWLGDSYDHLGLVLLSSFVSFGIVTGGLAALMALGRAMHALVLFGSLAAFYILLVSPLNAAVHVLAKKIITHDDPSAMDLIHGFREYLTASWALGSAQVLMTLIIAVNTWFYLTHGGLAVKALGVLFMYVLLFWMFSSIYHYPVLIEQRPATLKILKRGFLITMDNLVFTGAVFFVIILLTCLCTLTLLGLPLLYAGMLSILQTRVLRATFVKYELLPPEKEPTDEDTAWRVKDSV